MGHAGKEGEEGKDGNDGKDGKSGKGRPKLTAEEKRQIKEEMKEALSTGESAYDI